MPERGQMPATFDPRQPGLWPLDDVSPQGLFATDRDLVIRYWNPWMERHSGRTAADVIGSPLLGLYPDVAERKLDRQYQRVLEGETVVLAPRLHRFLIPLPVGTGQTPQEWMRQSIRIAPLVRGGQIIGSITAIDDVTERMQREEELRRQVSMHEALNEVARAILTLDLDECLRQIVTETAALLGADLVAVIFKRGDIYCLGASTTPVIIVDGQIDPLGARSRSRVSAPLMSGAETIGALVAESERVRAFGEAEQALLIAFSLHAELAIRNARLYADLQGTLAEVKTLKGFIPICASCKKIRDDQGFWDQIECYITQRSDARFSHTVCPDCARELYPELLTDL